MNRLKILALPLLALSSELALAQQLSLFESLDAGSEAPVTRPMPVPAMATFEAPASFTLQSLSRFGDEYHGVLLDANGNPVRLRWSAGEQPMLPGYAGVAVLGADEDAGLLLQQAMPCQPNEQQGISCASANVARLSLATRAPLKDQVAPQQAAPNAGPGGQQTFNLGRGQEALVDENGNTLILNGANGAPMDLQQLQTLLNSRSGRLRQRFGAAGIDVQQAEVVNGDEVPPGMRVVRTRFGDRMVPVTD